LEILDKLDSTSDWENKGICVGEPALIAHLDLEKNKESGWQLSNKITLNPDQAQQLYNLIARNQTVLQSMADSDSQRSAKALAQEYSFILSLPDKSDQKKQE
jgi:hypothetical protein